MVEEEGGEEHQDQSPAEEFPEEVWKRVAGEHRRQEALADVVGPAKKKNEAT